MDCLESDKKPSELGLLTLTDKQIAISDIFASHHSKSDVFLPDDEFYNEPLTPESITSMLDKVFKFLGVKHRSVTLHLDNKSQVAVKYNHKSKNSQITIGAPGLENPFVCGATVAHAVMHHFLHSRAKLYANDPELNEELTDLATIESGLAILILNSFAAKQPILGAMAEQNYLAECLDFFKSRLVVDNVWKPFVLPEVLHTINDSEPLPRPRLKALKMRIASQSRHRKFIISGSLSVVLLLSITGIWLSQQPSTLSAEMLSQRESIEVLKYQYKICEETVKRKQATWDTSDIYMQQQIDKDASRCISLRNRHNFEVSSYNDKIQQLN
jgi:hypothetical protein